ncbi:hypothetical protein ABIC28_003007 [Rhodococcus sp. PvR044]
MTDDFLFAPMPWRVLSLRCSRCRRVAAHFIADPELVTVDQIVAGGRWYTGRVRNPCRCDPPPAWPDPSTCRVEIARAVRQGLGTVEDRGKSITVHR